MQVFAFNGSPKGRASNTDVLVQAFLRGASRAGAQTETIYLADQNIHHCAGCFSCWFKTPGVCIHRDDMQTLLPKYTQADIVCLATPVYTWNMTAYLKNFVDRLAPLKSPLLAQQDGRYDLEDREAKRARFVVMANAGFPSAHNFDTLRAVFASAHPALEIYRNCGMALKKDDPRVKAYLASVEDAGYQLAAESAVQAATQAALQQEMMPEAEYVRMLGM